MKKLLIEMGSKILREVRKLDSSTDESVYHNIYSPESIEHRRFYNIGAGSFSHPCWTNVDGDTGYFEELYGKNYDGIVHDLFDHKPIPVGDGIAEIIYTSHTIEHLDTPSVAYLFADCYRMLRPGGIFRIVTPDINLHYRAWQNNDRSFFFWIDDEFVNTDFEKQCLKIPLSEASLSQVFLEEFAAGASEIASEGAEKRINDQELEELFASRPFEEVLDYCISLCSVEQQKKYPFRHMNWFNETKLRNMLEEAGFSNIYRSGYLQSSTTVLRNPKYFDQTLPNLSIYMEAVKS